MLWSGTGECSFAVKDCVGVLGTAANVFFAFKVCVGVLQGVLRSVQAGDKPVPASLISSVLWPHDLRHWRELSGEEEEWEAAR